MFLDNEQMFVVRWIHDEHRFDVSARFGWSDRGPWAQAVGAVSATWFDLPESDDSYRMAPSGLRLVGSPAGDGDGCGVAPWGPPLTVIPGTRHGGRTRRRTSPGVRRRRTLLAVIGLLLIALALPLSGTGGYSHPAGSAPAGNQGPFVYTVQPGDSLWSIAARLDPSADPRPLVAKLAAQTGSDTVRSGERIRLP